MKMNPVIRKLLNKLRKMDGRRPMNYVIGLLAVLVVVAGIWTKLDGPVDSGAADGSLIDGNEVGGDLSETLDHAAGEIAETPEETTQEETKPYRIPIGMVYYVKLSEYGTDLPYYDENGNELGRLHHRDQIEVLPSDGDEALFYYNEDYDTATIDMGYLSEEDPGRLSRPAIEPALSPEDAGTISIRIWKERRDLELLSDDQVIATYSVGLGGWPWDHKIAKGDSRTPEGEYYICLKKNSNRFYRSLGISYPNKQDAANGYEYGVISKRQKNAIDAAIDAGEQPPWNTALGGEIMIHGEGEEGIGAEFDWTAGCIAVSNEVIDILWEYCKVGVDVTIYP